MTEFTDSLAEPPENRCPHCDSVVPEGSAVCLMCGAEMPLTDTAVPPKPANEQPAETPVVEPVTEPSDAPDVVEFVMRERQSPLVFGLTAVFAIFILIMGALVLQYQSDEISMIIAPSVTPIPPTLTYTPTWTPLPTETRPPTLTPTITPTPAPTATPQPPRLHTVNSGETLIGLSALYRVSMDSILQANQMSPDQPIQVNQNLQIPWPTPTPPLEIVAVEINGELVLADPAGCERYEVKEGDSIARIANLFGVELALLNKVNRLDEDTILFPGDTVCIPEIRYGESLPPTPGPSPTPTVTAPPPGPRLLYPVDKAVIDPPDGIVTLQWTAVQDLAESEWYMVELVDANDLDALPYRGFTRDNAFQLPHDWRPDIPETRLMRWRVSLVNVTGWREDGLPIYTFGGEMSEPAFFTWLGAIPTATPTPTSTPTATPET